jgi:TetR/AcrR family fatty acid metabolism transcriptional regulator
MKVFAAQGIHNFRMIDIAVEAGVGKGTLYEYFPSKDDLIISCFHQFFEDYHPHAEQVQTRPDDPADKIRQFIKLSFDFFRDQKERLDIVFDLYAAGLPRRNGRPLLDGMDDAYRGLIAEVEAMITDGIERKIFRPVNARLAASQLLALLDGLTFQAAMGITNLSDKSLPDEISQTFLNGILS